MRNIINIQGHSQNFKYMVEYVNTLSEYDIEHKSDIRYFVRNNSVYLHHTNDTYFRDYNYWYKNHSENCINDYIPQSSHNVVSVRVYFPCHSIDNYRDNVKYMLTLNTYVGNYKVELGSHLIRRIDCQAIESGVFNYGLEIYHDCIEIDCINPYDILYGQEWMEFRKNVCGVDDDEVNNVGSIITATLYVVSECEDDSYIIDESYICGHASYNVSKETYGYLSLKLEPKLDELGWKLTTIIPRAFYEFKHGGEYIGEYDRMLTYLNMTYSKQFTINDIRYELIIKNNNTILQGPTSIKFSPNKIVNHTDDITQNIGWDVVLNEPDYIPDENSNEDELVINPNCGMKHFFESWSTIDDNDNWPHFEEGWFIQAAMTATSGDNEMYILSNEIPITQELFKYYVGLSKDDLENRQKIIEDMEIKNYTLVNKIENKIVQLERPDKSKSNIIQPVFFRMNDSEFLTLHPAVTENICINLDDYKSKVTTFNLKIGNSNFSPIGSNQYGIIFKIVGSSLPVEPVEGIYYILNEDFELVTNGKYKYVL